MRFKVVALKMKHPCFTQAIGSWFFAALLDAIGGNEVEALPIV